MLYWNTAIRIAYYAIISTLLSQLKLSLTTERKLARVDHLTQLWNARYFYEQAEIEAERSRRSGAPLTVAYCDVDNFKSVNDRFGHSAGDALLRDVGAVIRRELRRTDLCGRLGGDEFAIILPGSDADQAVATLERIKRALERAVEEKASGTTFSFGALTYDNPAATVDEMIRAADDLMYRVKRNGKSSIIHERAPAPDAR